MTATDNPRSHVSRSTSPSPVISLPAEGNENYLVSLVEHLISQGALSDTDRRIVSSNTSGSSSSAYRSLLEAASISPAGFADLVAQLHGLPRANPDRMTSGQALSHQFSAVFLGEFGLFPYKDDRGHCRLACADPTVQEAVEIMSAALGGHCEIEVASFEEVDVALSAVTRPGADGAGSAPPLPEEEDADGLRDLASGAPVVRALDEIFERAVAMRATDIHIEPVRSQFQIRIRIDGVLQTLPPPSGISARALVSRIKIISGLNIAERRLPQDGRTRIKVRAREFDVRVATMPTTLGEAAILRLLDRSGRLTGFDQLGLISRDATVIRNQLTAPYGLIIVTGPTGSGKTTTLAASLSVLNDDSRKILTIEDPVEYELPGISQSQVRPAVGLTFATALRSFLRQDPDVIMVGEMRDTETAGICIQASLTGHMVLSTLHTNSAASAITRLVDMGIEPFLLSSSLRAVVGQRLVRMLCPDCRRKLTLQDQDFERNPRYAAAGLKAGTTVFEPVGCNRCGNTGYRGRRAIFEVLEVDEHLRRQILERASEVELETTSRRNGMTLMMEDGINKALAGITSINEVFRVAAMK